MSKTAVLEPGRSPVLHLAKSAKPCTASQVHIHTLQNTCIFKCTKCTLKRTSRSLVLQPRHKKRTKPPPTTRCRFVLLKSTKKHSKSAFKRKKSPAAGFPLKTHHKTQTSSKLVFLKTKPCEARLGLSDFV